MMKLYVWNSPYSVSWGSSIAYVIAESEESAKQQLKTASVYRYGDDLPEAITDRGRRLHDPIPAPTRIVDLPAAEVYEWEE